MQAMETRVAQAGAILLCILSLVGCTGAQAKDSQQGQAVTKYTADWESLEQHKVPEWLMDAKFGIYAHWGVYSVPAFANEWYAKRMYDKNDKAGTYDHHRKKYGPQSEFGYKDLIPMFKAEKFDPDEWADLLEKSGVKYAGIAVVHHDGFLLWDSNVSRWCAGKMGPKRDLYGELIQAIRKHGIKTIATFHHIRTFDWYLPSDPKAVEEGRKEGWDLFDPRYADLYWNRYTSTYEDFIDKWKAKVKEVVDKYQPDVLWFDGGKFQEEGAQHHVLEVISYYLNRSLQWGRQVEVLNKLPTSMKFNFPREFGVLTFEEGRDRPAVVDRPWIDDMKISTVSWGYIEGQTYKPVNEIIDGLIDRVSRGGGLLLSLCPKADGTVNQQQKDVLLEIGRWLNQNGEAIYATRPWTVHSEGSLDAIHVTGGQHAKWVFSNCGPDDIRFTRSKDGKTVYAIALGWPGAGATLRVKSLATGKGVEKIKSVYLLGHGKVKWQRTAEALEVIMPDNAPSKQAICLRIR